MHREMHSCSVVAVGMKMQSSDSELALRPDQYSGSAVILGDYRLEYFRMPNPFLSCTGTAKMMCTYPIWIANRYLTSKMRYNTLNHWSNQPFFETEKHVLLVV
jgi:hypothetical protein